MYKRNCQKQHRAQSIGSVSKVLIFFPAGINSDIVVFTCRNRFPSLCETVTQPSLLSTRFAFPVVSTSFRRTTRFDVSWTTILSVIERLCVHNDSTVSQPRLYLLRAHEWCFSSFSTRRRVSLKEKLNDVVNRVHYTDRSSYRRKFPSPLLLEKLSLLITPYFFFVTHTHTISSFLVINRREDIDRRKHDLAIVAKIQLGFMKHHRQSGITELEENSKWI